MTRAVPIERALGDGRVLGAGFGPTASWSTWLAVLKAAFGSALNDAERTLFAAVSGGRAPPKRRVRELIAIAGRRSGKSRIAAAIAVYVATCMDHRAVLAPGETGMVLALAASRSQAGVVFGYARALLEASPALAGRIESVSADEIRLKGNVMIAVHTNSFRTVRGRTLLACIFDEAAFWRDETSANPDQEVYRAVLPALATTAGMLVAISSPYRRMGLLYAKHRDHYGRDGDDVLVVQAGTTTFNTVINTGVIEAARLNDPVSARAEWDAEFRADLSSFLDDASIDAAIEYGRPLELPPREGVKYFAFVDASAGRHDAFTIGIVHRDGERVVADVIRGRRPPFDPGTVAAEYAALARDYGCGKVTGDNYAAGWVSQAFRAAGAAYVQSALPRSALYLEGLPLFTRGLVSIPNSPVLIRELRLLERRTARSGKDAVDHGANGSDDHANALFGAMWLAASAERFRPVIAGPIIVTRDGSFHDGNLPGAPVQAPSIHAHPWAQSIVREWTLADQAGSWAGARFPWPSNY